MNKYLYPTHVLNLAEKIGNAPTIFGNNFNMQNLCVYVKHYVENVIIRQTKDKQLKIRQIKNNRKIPLSQQKWKCLLCNKINDSTIDTCPTKHNFKEQ